jgi:catechol 2,3-dioxygenase-like lactoylglutathione lyase family enzyme
LGRIAIEEKKTGDISIYTTEAPRVMPLDTPMLFAATTDANRSRAFYEKVLGLKFVSDDQFALVFEVGGLALRIQKVTTKPKLEYTVLGWRVKDIQAEVRRLTKAGVKFSKFEGMEQDPNGVWRSPSGAQIAWFSDPDGNTLSLTQPV